ncbi:hypothetical protein AB4254_11500 [Vibrio breoganii]
MIGSENTTRFCADESTVRLSRSAESIDLTVYENPFPLIALDVDGVFADSVLSQMQYMDPLLQDPRITAFERMYPEYCVYNKDVGGITPFRGHSIRGLVMSSVLLLIKLAQNTESMFVLCSSWGVRDEMCEAFEALFQFISPRDKPYFAGQSGFCGGFSRELEFFGWLESYVPLHWESLSILAIDDSGSSFFPKMAMEGRLIAPHGQDLFTSKHYMESFKALDLPLKF